jgi:hypothetical protein
MGCAPDAEGRSQRHSSLYHDAALSVLRLPRLFVSGYPATLGPVGGRGGGLNADLHRPCPYLMSIYAL